MTATSPSDRRSARRDQSPKVLVIGAGKSGVASANFLAARGERVVLNDANAEPSLPAELDGRVERAFGRDDFALLDGVTMIVLSPGVPRTIPLLLRAAERAIPILGEIELAYRELKGTVIAITGSNGKSTTTALIGEILRVAGRQPIVAGNIGEPLISSVDTERPRTYVLELSSFQLESVDTFRANVALLLNITPDHMDRYANFDAYAAAKYRIFRNQESGDTAIVNASDRRELTPSTWCSTSAAKSAASRARRSSCRGRPTSRTRSPPGSPRAPPASTTWTCRSPSAPSPACRTACSSCASSTACAGSTTPRERTSTRR
jgi:UDP-N-acetylmuramoylalanine--D-glutamate ligase